MAVQQNRKTRSKRGMRRSHDGIKKTSALTQEQATGMTRRRHHMAADGFYRGREVIDMSPAIDEDDLDEEE